MYSKSCCMQHTVPLPLANTSTMITSFAQFAFHWFESNNLSRWVNLYIYHEPFLISNRQHLWNQSSPLESPGRPFASPASKVNIGDEKTHVQIYLANLDFPEIRGPMSLPKRYLLGEQVVWRKTCSAKTILFPTGMEQVRSFQAKSWFEKEFGGTA